MKGFPKVPLFWPDSQPADYLGYFTPIPAVPLAMHNSFFFRTIYSSQKPLDLPEMLNRFSCCHFKLSFFIQVLTLEYKIPLTSCEVNTVRFHPLIIFKASGVNKAIVPVILRQCGHPREIMSNYLLRKAIGCW